VDDVNAWKDYVLAGLGAIVGLLVTWWLAVISFGVNRLVGRLDSMEGAKANKESTNDRFEELMEERKGARADFEKRFDHMMAQIDDHVREDRDMRRELGAELHAMGTRLEDKVAATNAALATTNASLSEVVGELRATREASSD
jgi:chromosome segregation ATPase